MAQAALISRVGAQAVLGGGLRQVQLQGGRQLSSLFAASPIPTGLWLSRNVAPVKTFALFGSKKAAPAKTPAKKAPLKVEDGIFGTSGGIGFTKANELFVGRVAMLGFAASILGEALTGKGTLAQFDIETGIPLTETEPLLLFFILFTLLGAIGALGDRGRFVDESPVAGLDSVTIKPGTSVKGAFGLNERGPVFGFTKANELFVGRLAQLGIRSPSSARSSLGRAPWRSSTSRRACPSPSSSPSSSSTSSSSCLRLLIPEPASSSTTTTLRIERMSSLRRRAPSPHFLICRFLRLTLGNL
jgi:photosystem II protein